jgi:phage/plasmid primase-like uncharacterized protein
VTTLLTRPAATVDHAEPAMPVDPESLDATRPVDLDDCPACGGEGCLIVDDGDPAGRGACWSCGGDGLRGAW